MLPWFWGLGREGRRRGGREVLLLLLILCDGFEIDLTADFGRCFMAELLVGRVGGRDCGTMVLSTRADFGLPTELVLLEESNLLFLF